MNPVAIVILNQASLTVAKNIAAVLPGAQIYGLAKRTESVDVSFEEFGETVRSLYQESRPIVGLCAAGILIRTIAPLLSSKQTEPPVLAVAEDGSAVVPLVGGLSGVNRLARSIAQGLNVNAAITTSGDLRFGTALLSPPEGYRLQNPDDAKGFIADLLAGASVKCIGEADWLSQSQLPWAEEATHEIVVVEGKTSIAPTPQRLIYEITPQTTPIGKLTVIGLGPGPAKWLAPETRQALEEATDWFGYSTYLDFATPYKTHQTLHTSDNREELDRAHQALDLAASGRSVAVVSGGDPGIFAMAAAVMEALEFGNNPAWEAIDLEVLPGISAVQAAASRLGAPIGHDFCVISLSDILKPWEIIAQRLVAAAQGDFVIALYNPASKTRRDQLIQAQALLLNHRSPQTLVALARDIGRPKETTEITTLQALNPAKVDMRTLILVGSSQTRQFSQGDRTWLYTPRSYGNL